MLKAPVMIVSGLPPLVQIEDSTLFSRASVNASWLPSVRVPVPSAARDRRRAGGALGGVGLDPGQDRGGLARRRVVAGNLGLVGADKDGLHIALELEALEHLLIGELVVAAGVFDRLLGAGDRATL